MTNAVVIREDRQFGREGAYCWVNIEETGGARVGKARIRRLSRNKVVIFSINVFPEFERRGYARDVISDLKEKHEQIIADRVRDTAKGFWKKMGFNADGRGNYVWQRKPDTVV